MRAFCFLPLLLLAAGLGCSATSNGNLVSTVGGGGTGTSSSGSGSSSGFGASGAGGAGFDGGSSGSGGNGPSGPSLIYAHTDATLMRLDPTSANLALTTIGDFDCLGGAGQDTSMTDLAVDKAETLWGISATGVYPLAIQGSTVHCGAKIALQNAKGVKFYGLTFAPVGVLDAAKEVLVAGNTAGELWAVDGQGTLSQHGAFGPVPANDGNGHTYANVGKEWELSGDVVFLANKGNPVGYATVRDCPNPPSTSGCNAVNTLLEIDATKLGAATTGSVTKSVRGQIVKGAGCNDGVAGDYGNMYGIAAWNDKVYGFSRTGNLVEIDLKDGSACLVQAYAADKFAGAGVTTLAPVEPPPPK